MAVIADQEARAAAYRAQAAIRTAIQAALAAQLRGSNAALVALRDKWEPLMEARRDVRRGIDRQDD